MRSFISTIAIIVTAALQSSGQYSTILEKRYSLSVKDSFEIYLSTPADSRTNTIYSEVIYYTDASLKSGKKLRELLENDSVSRKTKRLFVGIGHIGNYHQLRRRDFILPFIQNDDTIPRSEEYGQVVRFYQFLQSELIPYIESKYQSTGKRALVGHSLGGLFAVYCLFRNEGLFDRYFALSPALWIDKYQIYSFNHLGENPVNNSSLFLSAGSKEDFNHILKGVKELNDFLKSKNYPGLIFQYHIYRGTHNGYISKSLAMILHYEIFRH
jgi:predicted alpha/beta superfamily hydrolase